MKEESKENDNISIQKEKDTSKKDIQEGKAMWNYVHTGLENATEYVVSDKSQKGIEEGLLEGDTIIVTGNLNLAHEAAVNVR